MQLETQSRIAILRQKALDGTLTLEEMKEAVLLMRADRVSAVKNSDASRRAKAKAVLPSADDMLAELGN